MNKACKAVETFQHYNGQIYDGLSKVQVVEILGYDGCFYNLCGLDNLS